MLEEDGCFAGGGGVDVGAHRSDGSGELGGVVFGERVGDGNSLVEAFVPAGVVFEDAVEELFGDHLGRVVVDEFDDGFRVVLVPVGGEL